MADIIKRHAHVLSGVPPIRLLALERKEIWVEQDEYRRRQWYLPEEERNIIRGKARETFFKRWQEAWNSSKDGRWTHMLIPKIKWVLWEHGSMEYRLTQGVSGHGCFGVHLATRGHRPNSNCRLCGEEADDGERPIFACPVHEQDRRELAAQVGLLLPKDNIIATMLESPDSWDRIASFIRRTINTKEEREREMRRKDW